MAGSCAGIDERQRNGGKVTCNSPARKGRRGAVRKPTTMTIRPVILSGGSGTRLWPLSRAAYPKQLMPLVGKLSLLQETVERVSDRQAFGSPFLICNDEHRFLVAEQLRALQRQPEA